MRAPTTSLGSRLVPSSSPTVVLTTSKTHPWSTPRASSPSWDARLSSWDSPRPTESEVAQPEKVLMPFTLVRASTLLDLLMTQIPSLSSRSRKSRTEDLLCSPCSDSTFRLLSLERVQLPTGRLTLLTHGPSTVSPRSSPPSSPLEELS